MTDFDPNAEIDSNEAADAYVTWCAENFMRLSEGAPRTYRTAIRCAQWLLVCSTAQLHVDEEIESEEEEAALNQQILMYFQLARTLERQRDRIPSERLIVLRSSLDCWEPVGAWAENLLTAAKCAASALLLIDVHPLVELWDVSCPDVWELLSAGRDQLAIINDAPSLDFQDFAVRRNEMVTAKFTWQRANNIVRHVGLPPLSPN